VGKKKDSTPRKEFVMANGQVLSVELPFISENWNLMPKYPGQGVNVATTKDQGTNLNERYSYTAIRKLKRFESCMCRYV
jgi:hypothetical protein